MTFVSRCDGKVSCKLSASNNAFGDPCRLTHKYLQVDYKCDDNYAGFFFLNPYLFYIRYGVLIFIVPPGK